MHLPSQSIKAEAPHHRPRTGAALLQLFGLVSLPALLLLSGQTANAEDYLHQIEVEAKRQAATLITIQATAVPNSLDATERLPSGLQQEPFEKALQNQAMSTYVLYQRLKPQDKARVFASYQQDNRTSALRELILKLLSATP